MSNKSSNYPDWVLKYKEKGTFVNKSVSKNGTVSYYLYRGHSEREKGTGKVKRIVDGCIGKITEKDGLIPARHRLPDKARLKEFGRSRICVYFTEYMLPGMQKTYGSDAEKVYVAAILFYIYGTWSYSLYASSWLCLRYPDVLSEADEGRVPDAGVQRTASMITYAMEKKLGQELPEAMAYCSMICLIETKGSLSCSFVPGPVSEISDRLGITWKEELWEIKR